MAPREKPIDPEAWPEIAYMADAVKAARTENGWSQREFGDVLGSNQPYVSALEGGRIHPQYLALVKIAAHLGKPVSFFILDRDPKLVLQNIDKEH